MWVPYFQASSIARAANRVARDYGIPYFASAGNDARRSWEGSYNAGPACIEGVKSCHDFGNGNGFKQRIKWTPHSTGQTAIFLQWDEPWVSLNGPPGCSNDVDIFLLDAVTGDIIWNSGRDNIGNDADDMVVLPEGGEYDLVIGLVEGAAPKLMKWILKRGGTLDVEANPPADASTIINHANAEFTAGVGAAFEIQNFGELKLQYFSSAGGTSILFDDDGERLQKPKVFDQPRFVGPDVSKRIGIKPTHSLTYSLAHSFNHSFTHSITHSITYLSIHPSIHRFAHLSIIE